MSHFFFFLYFLVFLYFSAGRTSPKFLAQSSSDLTKKKQRVGAVRAEANATPFELFHVPWFQRRKTSSPVSRGVTPYQLSSSFPAWINHTNFTRTNPYVTRKMLVCVVRCGCPQDCIRIRVIKYFISFTERNKGSFLFTSSWEWKVATLYLVEETHVRTKASFSYIIVLGKKVHTLSDWISQDQVWEETITLFLFHSFVLHHKILQVVAFF